MVGSAHPTTTDLSHAGARSVIIAARTKISNKYFLGMMLPFYVLSSVRECRDKVLFKPQGTQICVPYGPIPGLMER
jgi:hypothetical protein